MAEVLTAAEYRALTGSKPSKAPAAAPAARLASRPPKTPPAPVATVLAPVLRPPTIGTYPGPCSWLLQGGRVTVSLPKPFDPDRHRLVIACPHDPALLAALLATVEAYTPQ